jgi:hypothetical protein
LLQTSPCIFKSFGLSPLKLNFARKSVGNQQNFLQILVFGTKIKRFVYAGTNCKKKNIQGLKQKNYEFAGTNMMFKPFKNASYLKSWDQMN